MFFLEDTAFKVPMLVLGFDANSMERSFLTALAEGAKDGVAWLAPFLIFEPAWRFRCVGSFDFEGSCSSLFLVLVSLSTQSRSSGIWKKLSKYLSSAFMV